VSACAFSPEGLDWAQTSTFAYLSEAPRPFGAISPITSG
jgi:hypothetical protein